MKQLFIIFIRLVLLSITTLLGLTAAHGAPGKSPLQVHGSIMDQAQTPIPYVHVINQRNARISTSNKDGLYALLVNPGDTIRLSCMGYQTIRYGVPDSITTFQHIKDFTMTPDTIILKEFTVHPWKTYHEFKRAFLELELFSQEEKNGIRNIQLMMIHLHNPGNKSSDPGMSYRTASRQYYNENFRYKYQPPSNQLLNPFAWAQFFEALKKGNYNLDNDQ